MHTQRGRVSTPGGGGTPEPTICKPQADFIRNVEGRGSSPGNSASLSRHAPPPTLGQSPTPGITHTPEREDGTLKRTLLCTNPGLFSSVAQSYPPLCDPMDCSTPGLPLHQQLLLLCPQVPSLCLCLYSCPADRFISTIFLDSIYICINI